MAGMIPYEKVNALNNENNNVGGNHKITAYNRPSLTPEVATKVFDKLIQTGSARDDIRIVFLWEYHNLKKFSSVASDATAFSGRIPRPLIIMIVNWVGDSDELKADALNRLEQVRSFTEQALEPAFDQIGGKTELDTGDGNTETGDPQSEDSARVLYGPNYPRLQQLKKKYDPNMVFKSWYPIAPAA
ncbi:hypothetical protein FRC17_007132 [Serendipita sp. 399]|nr:hypothetical protein FRC17_007132 [Serendipita sp. 399]